MVLFKSLIVLDAETTSLPEFDHNTTKIIELSLIGCEVEHLRNSEELPRVLHKLVLLFNPHKPIAPNASKASGLTNELLMNVQPMQQQEVDIVRQFIGHLPSPVCLVAHNGDKFDFPILRRAFEKLGQRLQNNVYCLDSIKAFQHLLPKAECTIWKKHPKASLSADVTPEKQGTQAFNSLQHKKVSKVLFPDDDDAFPDVLSNQNVGNEFIPTQSYCQKPKSYKLRDIYYFYFGRYFEKAHRAEKDSIALLYCIMRCGGFLDWMNENAVIFNSIEPLF